MTTRFSHAEPPREKMAATFFHAEATFSHGAASQKCIFMHFVAGAVSGWLGSYGRYVVQEVQAPNNHARVYIARVREGLLF